MKRLKFVLRIVGVFLIIVLLIFLGLGVFRNFFNFGMFNTEEDKNYNDYPVEIYHIGDFEVKNSNYFEKNYDRYISYRNKNSNLTDDEIITRVNIGLDNDFYTNMRPSNLEDGILVLCNKYNYLPSNYVPSNLVKIGGIYSSGGHIVGEAYEAFKKLADDARKLGYTIKIQSGYRGYGSQKSIYNNYVKRDGVKKADTYSARPGNSEHQTGLAIDVRDSSTSYSNFRSTKEYLWMKDNSYKYGWILRYTADNKWITGYKQEEWHYRYVGVDVATYIYKNKITFEEYYANFIEK